MVFAHLFGQKQQAPDLLPAVDHAIASVEPLLKQINGYPDDYLAPVSSALAYAHALATSLPGPLTVNRESYASDPLVHALFPSLESVTEALSSSLPLQTLLRQIPSDGELYALMGMRRQEKTVVGMQLSGQLVQHDVVQNMVYFTSHTIDNPASSELQAREKIAMSFFDRLIAKVAQRIAQRKLGQQELLQEKDLLIAQLRSADEAARPALEGRLADLLDRLQATVVTLELERYPEDFAAILLDPAQHLRLEQTPIKLDSMGIRLPDQDIAQGKIIVFDDLIGYDRRNWTVTLVRCSDIPHEAFASKLERAYRTLTI
ncbi:MAG TPA: hypothetical protein VFW59_07605 [Gallionella sp.]|nr:hypothetical protein [Gallionella sp.]